MADEGIRTIINLRTEGEDMQRIEPDEEGRLAEKHGLAYVSLPTSMDSAGPGHVDRFRQELRSAEKPVFVHRKLAKRVGAFVMMDQAVRAGWTGQQTLDQAEQMGFECDDEDLESFVRDYVDQKQKG